MMPCVTDEAAPKKVKAKFRSEKQGIKLFCCCSIDSLSLSDLFSPSIINNINAGRQSSWSSVLFVNFRSETTWIYRRTRETVVL